VHRRSSECESGIHRSDLLRVALPVRLGDDLGEDREEEEQTEHDADGGGRFPHDPSQHRG
jgi:hypothetical protein